MYVYEYIFLFTLHSDITIFYCILFLYLPQYIYNYIKLINISKLILKNDYSLIKITSSLSLLHIISIMSL